ncbi:hypothetical protein AB0H83_08175 [Dactylosporangium sp. NPDC050688]|uniref:hypothetical protein n=1 Tax=Dactylosporangium sp. NPDC050688 TaxID=3157217 RepID=UPI00340AEA16
MASPADVVERARPSVARPLELLAQLLPVGDAGTGDAPGRQDDPFGGYRPVIRALLRNAGQGCAARGAELWLPDPPDGAQRPPGAAQDGAAVLWRSAIRWRGWRPVGAGARRDGVADPALLSGVDGVAATAEVPVAGSRGGMLVLVGRDGAGLRPAEVDLLGDTAVCLGLLLREAAARDAARAAQDESAEALRRVSSTQLELSTVQAVERDRLAAAVTTTSGRQLRAIVAHTTVLESALASGDTAAVAVVATIRANLLEMIEQFRTVVRGVYPQVLRSSGVAAALAEMATAAHVPVAFHGDLGRRQGWEVESGLYQAAASALTALCAGDGATPVMIGLARHGDILTIRLERAGPHPDQVTADLRDDTRRLAALGGRLMVTCAAPGSTVTVEIWLPERWGGDRAPVAGTAAPSAVVAGAGPPPGDEAGAGTLPRRLRQLLLSALGTQADGPAVRAAVDRQDGRVRVAVLGPRAEELTGLLCGRTAAPAAASEPGGTALCYQYGPVEQITVEPIGMAPPWRRIRVRGWSGLDRLTAGQRHRTLLERPSPGLRGLRLVHHRQRVDASLAAALRRWSSAPDGPPDVVILALDAMVTTAQSEFLGALRSVTSTAAGGFAPVVICAHAAGPAVPPRLDALCDTAVAWPAGGDAAPVEAALEGWVRCWSGLLGARWALRALTAVAAAGGSDEVLRLEVEAATVGADELAELDLLEALRGGRIRLPAGHDDALRLLGADGRDPCARLGLAEGAGAAQIRAAGRALAFWRTQAMRPDPGAAGRSAYASLVRLSERLLTGG